MNTNNAISYHSLSYHIILCTANSSVLVNNSLFVINNKKSYRNYMFQYNSIQKQINNGIKNFHIKVNNNYQILYNDTIIYYTIENLIKELSTIKLLNNNKINFYIENNTNNSNTVLWKNNMISKLSSNKYIDQIYFIEDNIEYINEFTITKYIVDFIYNEFF